MTPAPEPVPAAVEAAVRAAVPAASEDELARILAAYGRIRALADAVADEPEPWTQHG